MNPHFTTAALLLLTGCMPKYADRPSIQPEDLRAPLPVQHITVDGVDVAFIDSGTASDQPPIVFIHGLSSYMSFWDKQISAFKDDRRVLALDLPGYGASGRPDAPFTPPWYAEVVVKWLDELNINEAVVVGHSMGGQTALWLTLEHPERVDRLVLSAPAGIETFTPGAADFMKSYWTEDRALEASEYEIRANFTQAVFNAYDNHVELLIEERVRMGGTEAFEGTSVAVSRSIAGMVDNPVHHRLPEINVPTLLVFGTHDKMIPNPVFNPGSTRAVAEQAQARIRGSELVMVPRAGHTVHHDDPVAFNSAVRDFLGSSQ